MACENCGYTIEINDSDLMDYIDCICCGGRLVFLEEVPEIQTDVSAIDRMIVEQLQREMDMLGVRRVYEIIEQMTNPITRGRYRKYFLLAGGYVPESEV